jgi:UDP-N-acetylmuramoylalanine--D-glutamate ligase
MTIQLDGARVTVVGLGQSGLSATRLLVARGAQVIVNDMRSASEIGARAEEVTALGARLDLGGHDEHRLSQSDIIVLSPGVPALPALRKAEERGVRIASEIELASWFIEAPIIGITGTNGKSTVTTLVGEMCKASGRHTFVGGNLGTPLVDVVGTEAASSSGLVVVELSSFQLERVDRFRAHVAVLLNVTDDHLDRYDDFADYARAKARIFAGQTASDFAVANGADELCTSMARASAGELVPFAGSVGRVHRQGETLRDEDSGLSLPVQELGIQGEHNVDNACAAALAARLAGVDRATIAQVLRSFRGLPHRMQRIGGPGEIAFYDDSKATNVGAAVAAIEGLGRAGVRVVLIAGGKDKGGSYLPLVSAMRAHGRALVLIGEATPLIANAFSNESIPVEHAVDMSDAVRRAASLAAGGDAVLLAPACASFDMFRSYAHRGDVFAAEVGAYLKGRTRG